MKKYMQVQKNKIEIDQWGERTQEKKNTCNKFVLNWIEGNAAKFRKAWEISLCKTCSSCAQCGHLLKLNCDDFATE